MKTEIDFKKESSLLSFIIFSMLPDTRKGKWTSFESIMNSNAIANWKFTEEQVKQLLHYEICSHLFENRLVEDKMEYCFNRNWMYTQEERASSTFDIHNLKES